MTERQWLFVIDVFKIKIPTEKPAIPARHWTAYAIKLDVLFIQSRFCSRAEKSRRLIRRKALLISNLSRLRDIDPVRQYLLSALHSTLCIHCKSHD